MINILLDCGVIPKTDCVDASNTGRVLKCVLPLADEIFIKSRGDKIGLMMIQIDLKL